MSRPVPISDEQGGEVLARHACIAARPPGEGYTLQCRECRCKTTVGTKCAECGEMLFFQVAPGTWCEHAELLHEGMPNLPLASEEGL